MIPFSISLYPLLILLVFIIGLPCALVWFVWFIKLSPTARQNFNSRAKYNKSMMIFLTIISIIWLLSVVESYRLNRLSAKIAEEIVEEEEAIRTPTLSQETILAGITMPAGTRLELLHQGAVGTQWVKPEYFEFAYFPKPILWQGVPVTQLHRFLDTKQDNDYFSCRENNSHLGDEECSQHSSYEDNRLLWSDVVGVVDKPLKMGKFYCQGEIT